MLNFPFFFLSPSSPIFAIFWNLKIAFFRLWITNSYCSVNFIARDSQLVLYTYMIPDEVQCTHMVLTSAPTLLYGTFSYSLPQFCFLWIFLLLGPLCDQKQRLYFHSFASLQESWVNVSSLRDPNIVTDSVGTRNYFYHSGDIRAGQSTVEVITYDGILLYSVLPLDGIGCWNTAEPLTKENQHVIYRVRIKIKNQTR